MLEVGCGERRLTVGLAEEAASAFAFDPDQEAVAVAGAGMPQEIAERVTFRVGSARQIEIPRTPFEIVSFSWSL